MYVQMLSPGHVPHTILYGTYYSTVRDSARMVRFQQSGFAFSVGDKN